MALLLCERQQNWLRVGTVVSRTIGIYVITSTFVRFLRFFSKSIQKVVTFYVFLPCFVRFLELCLSLIRALWGRIIRPPWLKTRSTAELDAGTLKARSAGRYNLFSPTLLRCQNDRQSSSPSLSSISRYLVSCCGVPVPVSYTHLTLPTNREV